MAYAVWWPCPCDSVPANTVADPSAWTSMAPNSSAPPPAVISTYDGHTDPEEARVAGVASLPLLGAQCVVADLVGRPVEGEPVPARVVGVARDRREREHVVAEEVLLADLDRIDAELQRRLVDRALDEGGRLGSMYVRPTAC